SISRFLTYIAYGVGVCDNYLSITFETLTEYKQRASHKCLPQGLPHVNPALLPQSQKNLQDVLVLHKARWRVDFNRQIMPIVTDVKGVPHSTPQLHPFPQMGDAPS